jgi:hypothetical protein
MTAQPDSTGLIVQTWKDQLRILWTYVPLMPAEHVRLASPWLTVLSWVYDGTADKGMPCPADNQLMTNLDLVLGKMEDQEVCFEAYRRIGAGLREFVFYSADRDRFLELFNGLVAGHPRYPIEIKFFKDETWSELQDLIDDLR